MHALLVKYFFLFSTPTISIYIFLKFVFASAAGFYPKNSPVKFRGDSGLQDGSYGSTAHADLVGGFYDSGNNMKFSFPTAYTITLLSWSVIEYHQKYSDIDELDHVKDIIKWGTEYLLKVFIPPSNSTSDTRLYSQARPSKTNLIIIFFSNIINLLQCVKIYFTSGTNF